MPSHSSSGDGGHVDVDELAGRQARARGCCARRSVAACAGEREVGMLVVLLRDRERRAAVDDRLHRRADRARVRDVVAEVRAVVDARRDEVEAVPEVAEEREADRVGGRAVDRVGERAVGQGPLADAQRPHQRLLVADRALVGVGGDDRDVAHRLERLLEREQAARLDAVVVGDQDPRPGVPLARAAGPLMRRARGPPRSAPPASGSPRSLSTSRRSDRARSRVMSGAASARRASAVSALVGSRSGVGVRPVGWRSSSTSAALPGAGSRGTRTGAALALAQTRVAARPATVRSPDDRCRKWKKNAETTAAIGMPKMAPGMPAMRDPMRTDAEDDDRVDADGALHDPRLEDVHDHEPADAP